MEAQDGWWVVVVSVAAHAQVGLKVTGGQVSRDGGGSPYRLPNPRPTLVTELT